MKKILLVVCLCVLGIGTHAQRYSTTVTKTKTSKPGTTDWYFKAGLNAMKFTGDDVSEYSSRRLGYKVDLGFKRTIQSFDAISIYWGMDFSLGSRGEKNIHEYEGSYHDYYGEWGSSVDYTQTSNYSRFFHNIQWMPINVGVQVPLIDKLSFDAHIGVFVSYDYFQICTDKTEYSPRVYMNRDESESQLFDDDAVGDIGFNFGMGIWWDKFNFEIGFQNGLVNYNGDDEHTNNILFKVGFMF